MADSKAASAESRRVYMACRQARPSGWAGPGQMITHVQRRCTEQLAQFGGCVHMRGGISCDGHQEADPETSVNWMDPDEVLVLAGRAASRSQEQRATAGHELSTSSFHARSDGTTGGVINTGSSLPLRSTLAFLDAAAEGRRRCWAQPCWDSRPPKPILTPTGEAALVREGRRKEKKLA